uniref:putative nuclease HARBI1 n=1 Tax=Pristiophorus japonicus TaxID=55135 RepID=UPI00398E71EA
MLRELCNLRHPDLQPQTRLRIALSIETKLTIALNVYATGSFQSATADISNISQFSAHRSIHQVTDPLHRRRLQYISFPMSREKQVERQAVFVRIAGCPRVQGAIGCTHVALRAPQTHAEMFINRKGIHSLNVELVCDHQRKIMAVDARYPGSSHDVFILRQGRVPTVLSGPNQDCGWLLEVPLPGGVLQYSPERVSIFIIVCCMLHNPAIMRGQSLRVDPAVAPQEEAQEEEEEKEDQEACRRPPRRHHRHPNPAREVQTRLFAARFR